MIRINQLKLNIAHTQSDLERKILKTLHMKKEYLQGYKIRRQSIDARKKPDLYYCLLYTSHKYPFVVLHIEIDGEHVDVNVHPTKMELRFNNQQEVYNAIYSAVEQGLHEKELIPHVEMPEPKPVVSNTPAYAPKQKTCLLYTSRCV